jgi:hypothetical protein
VPPLRRITCPTKKPSSPVFPPRYSSALAAFSASTASTAGASAPASLTWRSPRRSTISAGSPPPRTISASTVFPAALEIVPSSTMPIRSRSSAGVKATSTMPRSFTSSRTTFTIQFATAAGGAPSATVASKTPATSSSRVSTSASAGERPSSASKRARFASSSGVRAASIACLRARLRRRRGALLRRPLRLLLRGAGGGRGGLRPGVAQRHGAVEDERVRRESTGSLQK